MIIINIIILNGSKRKGNTFKLIKRIEEYYKNSHVNIYFTYINLGDYIINTCLGCETCINTDICPLSNSDDVETLMKQLINSDKIILSSPVYLQQVSGLLKTFIDRTCKWFHRPELIGKPILVVTTTASSGLKNTSTYLKSLAVQWGAIPIGTIKRKVTNYNNTFTNTELKILDSFINFDINNYSPSIYQITMYQVQKVLANKIIKFDKKYWIEKGWMKKVYFYDKNISIFKKVYSNLFYYMLNNKIKPIKK